MSYRIMKGTKLGGLEKMMTTVPNFDYKKGNNMNEETTITLLPLLNLALKKGATHNTVKNYNKLLETYFGTIERKTFQRRLDKLINEDNHNFFISNEHLIRFMNLQTISALFVKSRKQLAILYLIASDDSLYNTFIKLRPGNISKMKLPSLTTNSYAIYKAAKMIETGNEHIKIKELSDCNLINDSSFKVIINSLILLNIIDL